MYILLYGHLIIRVYIWDWPLIIRGGNGELQHWRGAGASPGVFQDEGRHIHRALDRGWYPVWRGGGEKGFGPVTSLCVAPLPIINDRSLN